MATDFQANLSLWLNCNLKCPYCFGNPTPAPSSWPANIAESLDCLERFLKRTGRWRLHISGGETTIYPGFADLCGRLAEAKHEVVFFTNGIVPLEKVFGPDQIKAVNRVDMSYQLGCEELERYDRNFENNLQFLQRHGIEVGINYVLYPKRKNDPTQVKKRFDRQGVQFRFLTFQGEFEKRQYPFAHSAKEIEAFSRYGDLRARFLMEHGYYMPTFKSCRAGSKTFYISLRTGGVYVCEQLQQCQLASFTDEEAVENFLSRISESPMICPAKRCTCRLTIDQEIFLKNHDVWDMACYPEWERLSLPTVEAVNHWNRVEQAFADELATRLSGMSAFIWGGGVHTLILLRLLKEKNFPMVAIHGIIDSNPLKHGQEILGLPIVSRDYFETRNMTDCSDVLISSRAFEAEIANDIAIRYGNRFNVIRLYDGTMRNRYEALEGGFNF